MDAYVEAGYKALEKEETLRGTASRLRSNAIVAARIAELQNIAAERAIITQVDVLKGLVRGATFDIRKLYHDDGRLKSPHELDDDTARVIVGCDIDEIFEYENRQRTQIGETKKYKFERREKYWEMLGRHLKMFTDVVKHEGLDQLAERLTKAESRLKE